MPSRATYFTGRDANQNGCYANEIILGYDDDHLFTRLRRAGYQLALTGKNHAFKDDELRAWDFVELYGVGGKEAKPYCSSPTEAEQKVIQWRSSEIPYFESAIHKAQPESEEADPAFAQTSHAVRFLEDKRNPDRPFFLWASFEAPHFPYVLPEPRFSRTRPQGMPGAIDPELWKQGPARLALQHAGLNLDQMSENDIRRVQASYCGMIEMVDDQVGRILDTLDRQGLAEDTIVIFASDHGDFWGHRGLIGKSNAVYEDLIRIPTIWRAPGRKQGIVNEALIQNVDFTPTLLDLLDLDPPHTCQGISYKHALQSPDAHHRNFIVSESSLGMPGYSESEINEEISDRKRMLEQKGEPWFLEKLGGMTRSLYSPPYKWISHECDPPEMYNLEEDPFETVNLLSPESYK